MPAARIEPCSEAWLPAGERTFRYGLRLLVADSQLRFSQRTFRIDTWNVASAGIFRMCDSQSWAAPGAVVEAPRVQTRSVGIRRVAPIQAGPDARRTPRQRRWVRSKFERDVDVPASAPASASARGSLTVPDHAQARRAHNRREPRLWTHVARSLIPRSRIRQRSRCAPSPQPPRCSRRAPPLSRTRCSCRRGPPTRCACRSSRPPTRSPTPR